jgi:hypothetical protein
MYSIILCCWRWKKRSGFWSRICKKRWQYR